jgi:hypothetical protein
MWIALAYFEIGNFRRREVIMGRTGEESIVAEFGMARCPYIRRMVPG